MSAARRIDGKAAAADVLAQVATDVAALRRDGIEPTLAVVLVGDDPASDVYVRNKVQRALEVGIRSLEHRLPAETGEGELLALVRRLNDDPSVHGILVQMPLPRHLSEAAVIQAIRPDKDVDGFHRENAGALAVGQPALTPCTPAGCLYLLERELGDLTGKHAVVIGRSNIVGRPMAALLLQANCTVTTLHSKSRDAPALCRLADIVVVAAGRPGLVDASWLKADAVVIDVGIHRVSVDGRARLVGDVNYDSAATVAAAITPVPGGVGPMTIAFLMRSTVSALRLQMATRE